MMFSTGKRIFFVVVELPSVKARTFLPKYHVNSVGMLYGLAAMKLVLKKHVSCD